MRPWRCLIRLLTVYMRETCVLPDDCALEGGVAECPEARESVGVFNAGTQSREMTRRGVRWCHRR